MEAVAAAELGVADELRKGSIDREVLSLLACLITRFLPWPVCDADNGSS